MESELMLAITVCRVGVGVDVGVPARAGEREKAKAATQRNREETICFIGIDLGKGLINGDKLLLQQFFPFISRYEAHEERQGFPSPFVPSCENKTAWSLLQLSAYFCKLVLYHLAEKIGQIGCNRLGMKRQRRGRIPAWANGPGSPGNKLPGLKARCMEKNLRCAGLSTKKES